MAAGIVHVEFKSANFARTSEFYSRVFDWQTEQNAAGSYMKLNASDGTSGGWVRADLVQAPGPVAYLTVDDLEAKLAEIEQAGGRVLVRSLPFAGGGEVALFADPDGNVLGLWRRKTASGAAPNGSEKAAPAAKPEKAAKPAAPKRAPKKK
ncbi:MAG TPA: VOC family protein [Polyangia bacterium]|nr:VOC family protein [Polyangia bacterium]